MLSWCSLEDCTDCFGAQKKDDSNDKEKKEEEEASIAVHHSIIETWDWGRQPGELQYTELQYNHIHLYDGDDLYQHNSNERVGW